VLYGFYIDSDTFVQFFQINQIEGHFFKLKHDRSVVNLDFVIPRHRRRDFVLALSIRPSFWHFCVRSHTFEVLWRILLKLGMSIYMDKRMMHAKWHCTPSVNNEIMAIYILKKNAF
jgi:hypothetical protein